MRENIKADISLLQPNFYFSSKCYLSITSNTKRKKSVAAFPAATLSVYLFTCCPLIKLFLFFIHDLLQTCSI